MKKAIIDLTDCKYLMDLHERIKDGMGFPEWYGKNWNAFWDLMWSECDADKVIIKGELTLPKEFEKSLSIMHEILDDKIVFNEKCNFNTFSYEIVR